MGKTIALIDDSKVMRSILRKSILMSDLEVQQFIEAENGLEGLNVIERNQEHLDLIITDLHMPELGGIEMLKKIKEAGGNKAPIVVISTVGDAEMQQTCKNLGAVAFIEKPFSHEDIEKLLNTVF
jgi:two-component system chemotaxis response regulator CheY